MNRAVFLKTLRDTAWLLVLLTVASIVFEILFVRAMREFSAEMSHLWMQKPIIRRMVSMLVGADVAVNLTPTTLMAIGVAHPLLYAFHWIFVLTTCSRVIVGEIDRGTADLLLSLPVSRAGVYASVSAMWVVGCVPLAVVPLLGIALGQHFSPLWEPIDLERVARVMPNLLLLDLAIGSVTMFVSAWASRRGIAVAVVLGALLLDVLISFIGMFWDLAARLWFLGFLDYYQPLPTIRSGAWPVRNLIVLASVTVVFWLAGLIRYARRDIPAT